MTGRYILNRIFWTLFLILGSSVVIFLVMRLIPGDPARAMLGMQSTPEAVETLRRQLGLNEPLWQQYFIWISRAAVGDLGESILLSQSVVSLLGERLPVTLLLSAYSLAIALFVAIPLSMVAATHRGSFIDHAGRFLGILGLAMPSFWLGLVLMLVFAVNLRWLPVSGYVQPSDIVGHLRHMVLPSVALGAGYAAIVLETSRNSLIEVFREDYIRTARAEGLSERSVRWKYAMRNALIPTVTVIGIQIGYLMSGAVIVENVFAIPGLGRLLVNGVLTRDYPLVQACMLVVVLVFSIVALVVDLINAVIDPRIARAA